MTRLCECGGVIREHQLTPEFVGQTREAWTCNACGRYQVVERTDKSYQDWFSRVAMLYVKAGKDRFIWEDSDESDWETYYAKGFTPEEAVNLYLSNV